MKLWISASYENLEKHMRNPRLLSMTPQCNNFAVISSEELQLRVTDKNQ